MKNIEIGLHFRIDDHIFSALLCIADGFEGVRLRIVDGARNIELRIFCYDPLLAGGHVDFEQPRRVYIETGSHPERLVIG